MHLFLRLRAVLAIVFLALSLGACGGGGGSSGSNPSAPSTPSTPSTPATPDSQAGGGGQAAAPKLQLISSDASGKTVTRISISDAYTLSAAVTDAAGSPVANKRVSFGGGDNSLVTISPSSALTDARGLARVGITPASVSAVGATTVTALASVDGAEVSGQMDIGINAPEITLDALAATQNSLPSGGNANVSTTVLIGGRPAVGVPINVNFSASCGRINGSAGGFTVTTNGSGFASADYSAIQADGGLCSGTVNIKATSAGASAQTLAINVVAPVATAITFVSATPSRIYIAGSGALDQSVLKFKVQSRGSAMAAVPVTFGFSNDLNPLGARLGATSGITDSQGEVVVPVFSGTLPGPLKVRAAISSNPSVFTETQNLSVASGPPSQRFMSLAVSKSNIEGAMTDGSSSQLTVRLADRQGNAVEDGTVVNFTAEGGQVGASCATKEVGGISSCTVDLISQNPRPNGLRVSVLAFVAGTKNYTDVNFNNTYDPGDLLENQGDAYRDDNENGVFDAGEFRVPRSGSDACPGTGGSFPAVANTCDALLETTVRQQAVILFSSPTSDLRVVSVDKGYVAFTLGSTGNPILPMPVGTSVEVSTVGSDTCKVKKLVGSTVPNVLSGIDPLTVLRTFHEAYLEGCVRGDAVIISTTSPSGVVTSHPSIPIP